MGLEKYLFRPFGLACPFRPFSLACPFRQLALASLSFAVQNCLLIPLMPLSSYGLIILLAPLLIKLKSSPSFPSPYLIIYNFASRIHYNSP